MKTAIYTSTFSDYDILMSPVRKTPGCDYVAFVDKSQPLVRHWQFRPLPKETAKLRQNEANRFCKLFPTRILPGYDMSIYVDGNILIGADLSPLIAEFMASGADIALFPGQNGRTVEEEIELTLQLGAVRPERLEAALRQLADLRVKGVADLPVTMNGILFRRHDRPRLDALMEAWWKDINTYAMRDQYGLPGLLAASDVAVHHWDWQYFYTVNPYFRVYAHRKGSPRFLTDLTYASRMRARFSLPDKILWGIDRRARAVLNRLFPGG